MGKWFLCTLKPLGDYFFGGEHIFDLTGEEKSYFIKSERLPNQSSILGTLRFLVLSKAGLLNDACDQLQNHDCFRENQVNAVGMNGFIIEGDKNQKADFGSILSLSPVFLTDNRGHRWLRTPYNHIKSKQMYSCFTMKGCIHTDISRNGLLPLEYNAKDGLTDSFMDIDDKAYPIRNCIKEDGQGWEDGLFSFSEHTRIYRQSDKEGFFKKLYCGLNPDFQISFYCETKTENDLPEREVVYLGQDKSAFHFSCINLPDSNDPIDSLKSSVAEIEGGCDADVYYALSDIYLPEGINEEHLLFSIVKTKPFRTLTQNLNGGKDFYSSRIRSKEYQLIQAGSVFYVDKGITEGFVSDAGLEGMKQVGFNYLVLLGGTNNE